VPRSPRFIEKSRLVCVNRLDMAFLSHYAGPSNQKLSGRTEDGGD
jgi:hypothetical protein